MTRIISTTLAGPGTAPIIGDALRSVARLISRADIIWTGADPERADLCLAVSPWAYRVADWPWRDDFAAARNAALDFAAESEAAWMLMLDTDERVRCPAPAAVHAFLEELDPRVCVVVAFSADGSYGRERFFRLPARHRWTGRTHEAFPVAAGEQTTIPPELIAWDELPKSEEQLRAKNERDVAMLTAEIAEHPDDGRWRFYLAGALSGLGRNEEAIEAYREAADRSTDEFGAMACARAAVLLCDAKRWPEAVACCARGLTMRADMAELSWLAAGASYNAGELSQAEAWARLALVHGEAGPGRDVLARRVGFRMPRGLREGPGEILALVEQARGRTRPALVPSAEPIHITVTSTGFRAAEWAPRCVYSVAHQTTDAAHVYVGADEKTIRAVAAHRVPRSRFGRLSIRDGSGKGLLANLLPIWRSLPDDEVIVWLDGDDWLATDHALATVAEMHATGAWATYGSFIFADGCPGFAAPVAGAPRSAPWTASHLKTFRAGLVKRILDEHLRRADGEYLDLAIDQAVMLPILEMAAERAAFCPRVLAVYNQGHSFEVNAPPEERARESAEVARIRRWRPYARIESLTA